MVASKRPRSVMAVLLRMKKHIATGPMSKSRFPIASNRHVCFGSGLWHEPLSLKGYHNEEFLWTHRAEKVAAHRRKLPVLRGRFQISLSKTPLLLITNPQPKNYAASTLGQNNPTAALKYRTVSAQFIFGRGRRTACEKAKKSLRVAFTSVLPSLVRASGLAPAGYWPISVRLPAQIQTDSLGPLTPAIPSRSLRAYSVTTSLRHFPSVSIRVVALRSHFALGNPL
ncbi:hypothetical protein KC345_g74 [Hortaea werneckii]|nr:hypothetical protein KC345_g74 [Hortaea werneckii]